MSTLFYNFFYFYFLYKYVIVITNIKIGTVNMSININGEEYLSIHEVLELVKMSQASVYERMRYDRFPKAFKPEYRSYWKRSEIEEYIESTHQCSKTNGAEGK